jgi:hypothetical protein
VYIQKVENRSDDSEGESRHTKDGCAAISAPGFVAINKKTPNEKSNGEQEGKSSVADVSNGRSDGVQPEASAYR